MDNNALIEQIKEYEDEYKTFMRIKEFPSYFIQTKEATAETADARGFEVLACADYIAENKQHILTVSNNIHLDKFLMFHEFTHMLDAETYVKSNKVIYFGITGFTEYHASQVALMQLLGANNINDSIQFSMNDTINVFSGIKSVKQYIDEKQQHAIELFSRKDFAKDIKSLSTSVGVLFNYFGIRSICEMYSNDYIENIDNQSFLKHISTQHFVEMNNLMHGWLSNQDISQCMIAYTNVVVPIAQAHRLF